MALLKWMGRRWDRREGVTVDSAFTACVVVAADRERVWSVVTNPAAAHLIRDDVVRAFVVPGTPTEGVGSQTCTVTRDANRLHAHIDETTGFDRLDFIESVLRTGPMDIRQELALSGPPDGPTTLQLRVSLNLLIGKEDEVRHDMESEIQTFLNRLRSVIESGATFSG
ncbi:hypothetical protein KC207_14470 [Phycicoccus sp. BSK3Z-2]|uniref:Polyketide cyclase / dehydrase and lipid transport n=1 Tax=Phycicoccus avicenniae TaxID=2828860 RepID=A0A941DCK4_9MICO|nr:hypothetical protein [Phycicoccus avicenniae]MBR7744497.1 hypothetical protein [Phycicoccus avicenniae]